MGRRSTIYAVAPNNPDNRDHGKRFFITEMSAWDWEQWQARAAFAVSRGGGAVPEDLASEGIAGLLAFGLNALACCSFEDARPLMDELLGCVQIMSDKERPDFVRPGPIRWRDEGTKEEPVWADIEEASTIQLLRKEALELHLGFSIAAKWLEYRTFLAALAVANQDLPSSPTSLAELVA